MSRSFTISEFLTALEGALKQRKIVSKSGLALDEAKIVFFSETPGDADFFIHEITYSEEDDTIVIRGEPRHPSYYVRATAVNADGDEF